MDLRYRYQYSSHRQDQARQDQARAVQGLPPRVHQDTSLRHQLMLQGTLISKTIHVFLVHHNILLLLDPTLETALDRQAEGSLVESLVVIAPQLGCYNFSKDSTSSIHLTIPLTIKICLVLLFTANRPRIRANHPRMGFCHYRRWIREVSMPVMQPGGIL